MDNLVKKIIRYNKEFRKDRVKMLKSWRDDLIYMRLPTKHIDEKIKYYSGESHSLTYLGISSPCSSGS